MSDAPLMLGVSGLRGIVGKSLTLDIALRYAQAFGGWVIETYGERSSVAVAADGRAGYEPLKQAVIAGLLGSGVDVYDVGVQMTPTAGLAAYALMPEVARSESYVVASGIITASHNPQEWNGIKWLISERVDLPHHDGPEPVTFNDILRMGIEFTKQQMESGEGQRFFAPPLSTANQIIKHFESNKLIVSKNRGRLVETDSISSRHIKTLKSGLTNPVGAWDSLSDPSEYAVLHKIQELTAVVDSVNCSGSAITDQLSKKLGFRLVQLHGDASGIFPHNPEPTAENLSGEGGLCDAVPGLKADVGFAQDPDGDRLAIVDETGRYIGEEYTLVLAAISLLEADKSRADEHTEETGKTPTICVNLSTSRMIDDVAARYGARVVRTPVGEANVVEAMKRLRREGHHVLLGGEGNGGVIWPKVTYVRDSLSAMALTLSLMARTGKTVSQLVADIPSYAILKRKEPLARKELAAPTVDKLAAHYRAKGPGVRVDTQDGVRIDFDATRAWVHVRASNTEPILRLIAEAPSVGIAEAVLEEVQRLVGE